MTILYYTGATYPPQDLDPAFETRYRRDHDTLWPKVIRVHIVDELIYPIYPPVLTPDTFTFEFIWPKKGSLDVAHVIHAPHGHMAFLRLTPPRINVGTIGHVDYATAYPISGKTRNKILLQRSELLYPAHARAVHWLASC